MSMRASSGREEVASVSGCFSYLMDRGPTTLREEGCEKGGGRTH